MKVKVWNGPPRNHPGFRTPWWPCLHCRRVPAKGEVILQHGNLFTIHLGCLEKVIALRPMTTEEAEESFQHIQQLLKKKQLLDLDLDT